jgi:hypothetical protein
MATADIFEVRGKRCSDGSGDAGLLIVSISDGGRLVPTLDRRLKPEATEVRRSEVMTGTGPAVAVL